MGGSKKKTALKRKSDTPTTSGIGNKTSGPIELSRNRTRSQTTEDDLVSMQFDSDKQNRELKNTTVHVSDDSSKRKVEFKGGVNNNAKPGTGEETSKKVEESGTIDQLQVTLPTNTDAGTGNSSQSQQMEIEVTVSPSEQEQFGDDDESQEEEEDTDTDKDITEALRLLKGNSKVTKLFKALISEELKEQNKSGTTPKRGNLFPAVKSPSDNTVYKQALPKLTPVRPVNPGPVINQQQGLLEGSEQARSHDLLTDIDAFLGQARSEAASNDKVDEPAGFSGSGRWEHEGVTYAREVAESRILEAEKFKAAVAVPSGNATNVALRSKIGDEDEFMFVSCHVDNAVDQKVRKKEFVEFDKLIPKRGGYCGEKTEGRMEVQMRDGRTFLTPAEERDQGKIYSIKQWDEAFRVFQSIFCDEFPERAAELVQYSHTIHNANTAYTWENVLNYDYLFRKMMAKKPDRGWARINPQMWTMCMVNPKGLVQNNPMNKNPGFKKQGNWKDNTCWRFNKQQNGCNRGNGCRFEHRCNFCGTLGHGYYNCQKRAKSKKNDNRETTSATSKAE